MWLENLIAFLPSFIYSKKTKGFVSVLAIIAWKSNTRTSH